MSDVEESAATPVHHAAGPPMELEKAIQEVIKSAIVANGLVSGLKETGQALDRREAYLCVLGKDCDSEDYKKLITALCKLHDIPLIEVESKKKLGEWAGQCKIDQEGNARKVVACSSLAIKDWGKPSAAHDVVKEYINSK